MSVPREARLRAEALRAALERHNYIDDNPRIADAAYYRIFNAL
jgi:NAD-dependent DNA ligase